MSYLKTFSPWIAYWAGTAVADWRLGLAAGLVVGIAVLVSGRRDGVDVISAAGVVYFAALLPVALAEPASSLSDGTAAMALAVLGIAATASILLGRPFTETFARRETPQELWDTPQFRDANRVITTAWAVSFLVTAAVLAVLLLIAPDALGVRIAVQVVGFVVPIRFTSLYRARLRARYAPAALAGVPAAD